jgi:hypothetical protein
MHVLVYLSRAGCTVTQQRVQVRVQANSCRSAYDSELKSLLARCYGAYSDALEDRNSFGPLVGCVTPVHLPARARSLFGASRLPRMCMGPWWSTYSLSYGAHDRANCRVPTRSPQEAIQSQDPFSWQANGLSRHWRLSDFQCPI